MVGMYVVSELQYTLKGDIERFKKTYLVMHIMSIHPKKIGASGK